MSEFGKYIGLKFENKGRGPKFDCLGLVLYILKKEKNIVLPDYLDINYNCEWAFKGSDQLILSNIEKNKWVDVYGVDQAEPYDIMTFYRKEASIIVNHIGLYIGNYKFIHILSNQTSEISKFDIWKNKLHKILRYKGI